MLCRQSRCVRQVPAEQRVKGGEDKGESDESRADLPHPLGQPKVLVKSLTFIEDSPVSGTMLRPLKTLSPLILNQPPGLALLLSLTDA